MSKPTGKQLRYLRVLASQTGTTFATPRSSRDASLEIERLRRLKRQRGRYFEYRQSPNRDHVYGTAPRAHEIEGWGSTARWRGSPREEPRESSSRNGGGRTANPAGRSEGDGHPRLVGRVLARYLNGLGENRDVVAVPGRHGRLVVDRRAETHDDTRLVARLEADEPRENADIVTRLYVADPNRGRCRPVTDDDMNTKHSGETEPASVTGLRWDSALTSDDGTTYRLDVVADDPAARCLRWTKTEPTGEGTVVSLRAVVGELQDYEPAVSLTRTALREHRDRAGVRSCSLAAELGRVTESPIVLNRRLRERVEQALGTGVSMSEIAIRCGRIKRASNGAERGETSWLARRIGQLPEAGHDRPTPWVHTDVLALIARAGLGVAPIEVEL
jgi:hypothetical protein